MVLCGVRWLAVSCLIAFLTPARATGADWVRIDTPNVVVYSEAGEKQAREVASEFGRFRALGRVVSGAATPAAVPTVVVVFDTRKSFTPCCPMFNGQRVELAGYFHGTDYDNVVALTTEGRIDAFRVLFHASSSGSLTNVPVPAAGNPFSTAGIAGAEFAC